MSVAVAEEQVRPETQMVKARAETALHLRLPGQALHTLVVVAARRQTPAPQAVEVLVAAVRGARKQAARPEQQIRAAVAVVAVMISAQHLQVVQADLE